MKAIMPLLNYRINDGTLLLLLSLWIGTNSALQLCQSGTTTTNFINLNMDSSPITGTNGMCSCRINLTENTTIKMFPTEIKSPSCTTQLALSDTKYTFTCTNGGIPDYPPYIPTLYHPGEVLWLFVTSVSAQQPMTGKLQIKTTQQDYILECFNPNTNTSVTTQPTTTPTTTTSATTIKKSTTSQPSSEASSVSSKEQGSNTGTTTKPVASTISTPESGGAGNSSTEGTGAKTGDSGDGDITGKDFPVAAVAGGVGGGLLLIIVIIIAVTCLRKKKKEPHLLENSGDAIKEDKGHVNRAHFQPKPYKSNSNHNTGGNGNVQNHFINNELYASVDVPNKQQPRDNNIHNSPKHYASVDVINPGRSVDDHDLVEGPEIVITSSGDMYAVVDNLDESAPENRMDHEVSPSGDMYAVVDKSKLSKVQQESKQNHDVSASGDLYAVVNKPNKSSVSFADDVAIEPNIQATDDTYAVVNKPKRDQVFSSDTGTLEAGEEEEEEEDAINRMMSVPEIVLQDRVSFVESTSL